MAVDPQGDGFEQLYFSPMAATYAPLAGEEGQREEGLLRVDSMQGTSSLRVSVVNLFKSVVGAGVLSLPAGLAAVTADERAGLLPGLGLAALLAAVSAYSFWMLGRLSIETRSSTYAGLMVSVFGEAYGAAVEALIVAKTGSATLIYEMIMGNLVRDLALIAGHSADRAALLVALAALVLVPLSMMRSLASLAPFAAAGTLGVLYTAGFMGLRLAQGAYAPGGAFAGPAGEPELGDGGYSYGGAFVLVSMLSTAYVAHFNAPKFANQLVSPTDARLAKLCGLAFLCAFAVTGCVMAFGFLTFGRGCRGLVLDSYAVADGLAVWARLANLVSVLAGYPFVLVAFRDGLLQLVARPHDAAPGWKPSLPARRVASVLLIAAVTALACQLQDLGFVVALVGALLASTLTYVLPALALLGVLGPGVRAGTATRAERLEYAANKVMLLFGAVLALVGGGATCYGQAVKLGYVGSGGPGPARAG